MDCVKILSMLKEKGIDASKVAFILNLNPSTVSLWKKRKRMPIEPSGRRLIALFQFHYPKENIPSIDSNHTMDIQVVIQPDA